MMFHTSQRVSLFRPRISYHTSASRIINAPACTGITMSSVVRRLRQRTERCGFVRGAYGELKALKDLYHERRSDSPPS